MEIDSFNPKHCARRSVRAKYWKQCSTLEPATAYTDSDQVKLPNQRKSKKTGDGAERDRAQCAAETADQRSESRVEKLRVRDRASVPDVLLKLIWRVVI